MTPKIVMWGKVPVPYTAVWTGEHPLGSVIRQVPELGGYPFCMELTNRPGLGKPLFSTFHVGRAVEVMRKSICQICRISLTGKPVICIGLGNRTINGFPHIVDGLPMCVSCTALSLRSCPHLADENASVQIYQVISYGLAPAVLGPIDPAKGGRPEVNKALAEWRGPRPVYGTPKIYLRKFMRLQRSDLVEKDRP